MSGSRVKMSSGSFGRRVRNVRRSLKMNLVELSEATGIRLSRLSQIEHDSCKPELLDAERAVLVQWMNDVMSAG